MLLLPRANLFHRLVSDVHEWYFAIVYAQIHLYIVLVDNYSREIISNDSRNEDHFTLDNSSYDYSILPIDDILQKLNWTSMDWVDYSNLKIIHSGQNNPNHLTYYDYSVEWLLIMPHSYSYRTRREQIIRIRVKVFVIE